MRQRASATVGSGVRVVVLGHGPGRSTTPPVRRRDHERVAMSIASGARRARMREQRHRCGQNRGSAGRTVPLRPQHPSVGAAPPHPRIRWRRSVTFTIDTLPVDDAATATPDTALWSLLPGRHRVCAPERPRFGQRDAGGMMVTSYKTKALINRASARVMTGRTNRSKRLVFRLTSPVYVVRSEPL